MAFGADIAPYCYGTAVIAAGFQAGLRDVFGRAIAAIFQRRGNGYIYIDIQSTRIKKIAYR
jgi:hypothetical protein